MICMVKKSGFDRMSFLQWSMSAVLQCGRPCAPGFRKFEGKVLQSRFDGFFNKRCIILTAHARSGWAVRMVRITQQCFRSCISPSLTGNNQVDKMSSRTLFSRNCMRYGPGFLFCQVFVYNYFSEEGILGSKQASWGGRCLKKKSLRIPTSMKVLWTLTLQVDKDGLFFRLIHRHDRVIVRIYHRTLHFQSLCGWTSLSTLAFTLR